MKSFRFNDNLKITFPDDWKLEKDNEVVSLFEPKKGVGALQFSSYSPPHDIDLIKVDKELEDFLKDKYGVIEVKLANNYSYFSITDEDDLFWRYWLFKGQKAMMFISYNCEADDRGKEDKIVDEIIKSVL